MCHQPVFTMSLLIFLFARLILCQHGNAREGFHKITDPLEGETVDGRKEYRVEWDVGPGYEDGRVDLMLIWEGDEGLASKGSDLWDAVSTTDAENGGWDWSPSAPSWAYGSLVRIRIAKSADPSIFQYSGQFRITRNESSSDSSTNTPTPTTLLSLVTLETVTSPTTLSTKTTEADSTSTTSRAPSRGTLIPTAQPAEQFTAEPRVGLTKGETIGAVVGTAIAGALAAIGGMFLIRYLRRRKALYGRPGSSGSGSGPAMLGNTCPKVHEVAGTSLPLQVLPGRLILQTPQRSEPKHFWELE